MLVMESTKITLGINLSEDLLKQINQARFNEFGDPPLEMENIKDALFVNVLSGNELVATGRLFPIDGVVFEDQKYSVMGINGIVALKKGSGYGRKLLKAISDHLSKNDKTGIGFCIPSNRGFYEKCNFGADTLTVNQFRFDKQYGKEELEETDIVIFQEGSDHLITKLRTHPGSLVFFPCHPW